MLTHRFGLGKICGVENTGSSLVQVCVVSKMLQKGHLMLKLLDTLKVEEIMCLTSCVAIQS